MSFSPTPDEIAERYVEARDRVVALISDLPEDKHFAPVPATPKWTVHCLLSHLVGGPVDLAEGRIEGAGGEVWTQAQVEARRDRSMQQLLEEWDAIAPAADTAIRSGVVPSPVAFDILTHESDLRGAVGAQPTPDPTAIRFVAAGFGTRAVNVAATADLPPLELRATDTGWSIGEPGGVSAETTEHEWTRGLAGRRSNAQVRAYTWSGDAGPYLDLLSPFGPLPAGNVIE